jgi:hypothetical protein
VQKRCEARALSSNSAHLVSGNEIRRAPDAETAPIENVGVDHRRSDASVAEELLHRSDVVAVFEQVCGEGVPKSVAGGSLRETRGTYRPANRSLHR